MEDVPQGSDGARPDAQLEIVVVLGSVREGRRSERPAKLIVDRARALGHAPRLIDLRELDLPAHGSPGSDDHPSVATLNRHMARADAAVWLTPEYNHGYSSAIKNAVEHLGGGLAQKPSAVCGLSSGAFGGALAVQQLKQVLTDLDSLPIPESVHFTNAKELFDERGNLARTEFLRRIDFTVSRLAWYARALRWARSTLSLPGYPVS